MKKILLHKRYLYPALFFSAAAAVFIFSLITNGFSLTYLISLVGALGFIIISVMLLWKHRHTSKESLVKDANSIISAVFSDSDIYFPRGYFFRNSTIHKSKKIEAERINEINLNTTPPSLVIDNKEVIFIPYEYKEKLEDFGKRNNIEVTNRLDIWRYILEPFLDTSFTEDENIKMMQMLADNGIPAPETKTIRKQVKFSMFTYVYYSWEWNYLGQFDYLCNGVKTKKNYWWSMDIALRNYMRKQDHLTE